MRLGCACLSLGYVPCDTEPQAMLCAERRAAARLHGAIWPWVLRLGRTSLADKQRFHERSHGDGRVADKRNVGWRPWGRRITNLLLDDIDHRSADQSAIPAAYPTWDGFPCRPCEMVS